MLRRTLAKHICGIAGVNLTALLGGLLEFK